MKAILVRLKGFTMESVVKTRCDVSSPPLTTNTRKVSPIMIGITPPKMKELANDLMIPPSLISCDSRLKREK